MSQNAQGFSELANRLKVLEPALSRLTKLNKTVDEALPSLKDLER